MSSAEREGVPLKSMCSMKCEMPFSAGVSQREPVPIQNPTATLRTEGMGSVMTRMPLERVVTRISRSSETVGIQEFHPYSRMLA